MQNALRDPPPFGLLVELWHPEHYRINRFRIPTIVVGRGNVRVSPDARKPRGRG